MNEPAPRVCAVCGKDVPDIVRRGDVCFSCWQIPAVRRRYPLGFDGATPPRRSPDGDIAPPRPPPPGSYLTDPEEQED